MPKMSFKLELVWTLSFLLLIIHNSKAGEILYPKQLVKDEGEDVDFEFTTDNSNPILAANFGLKTKSAECDDMLKMIIVTTKEVKDGIDLDTSPGKNYKDRVQFIGNISLGHAWFRLKNVSVDDERVYVACIRRTGIDRKRVMYKVELLVRPSSKRAASSILTPTASSTERPSKLTTSPIPQPTPTTSPEKEINPSLHDKIYLLILSFLFASIGVLVLLYLILTKG